MKNGKKAKLRRKNRYMFVLLAIGPMLIVVLTVILFGYSELQGIRSKYYIDSEKIDSPYTIFDKVLLLNSYTKYDFLELQDYGRRNPDIFVNEEYLEKENENLAERYSFLAVIIGEKFTYFGKPEFYDDISWALLQENNNISGENSQYYGNGSQRFLFKKLGINLKDGRDGSVCIVTDLNVNLPHITIFTVGIIVILVVVSILLIIAIIGYTYYNILEPIRELQVAVAAIANGNLDNEIKSKGENEFTELYEELDSMRMVLKESLEDQEKSDALTKEVIGNISHDLKTPLTAIKGYAEGILDGVAATPERVDKYVKTIYTKASDMAVLVDELSYFTKIYQKKEKFDFKEEDVNRYFGECVADMALDLETRGIQLLYQCYVTEDTKVKLDAEKIKRVVANIIGNAVKYLYHDHGVILIRITEDDENISVMIQDNGKGIEEEELPFIFDRFYRTDSSRNSSTGGSGLGLAIAKKIIDEHGGNIWAESTLGKGTAIYFSLIKYRTSEEDNHE